MKTHQKIILILVVLALGLSAIGLISGISPLGGSNASQTTSSQPVSLLTDTGSAPVVVPTPFHPYRPNVGWNS